jgi:uncharacterized membrane protein
METFLSNTVFGQSIWGDEGFSAILSMKSLPDIIKIIATDTSPPLWNIWEWAVFKYLGTDEVYIRGLAFVFFLGAVFYTYKIGSLLFSKKTGAYAALLTFFNPFFFTYAFEGRMYSIMALGVAASMYYFLKIYQEPNDITPLTKVGYVFFTLWALYSHHFAIFAVFIQGIWWIKEFLFGKRVTSKKIFKLFLVVGLGYLPWIMPLYNQTKKVGGGFWLGTPTSKDLVFLFKDYLASGIKNPEFNIPIVNMKLHEIAIYPMLGILLVRKWHRRIGKSVFLILWFAGPIVLTWLVSQKFQSIFYNRYLLYAIPAGMIIAVSNKRKIVSEILIVTMLILFVFMDYNYFTHPAKLPFRELSTYVHQTINDGDYVINWNSSAHHLWETKYYGFPAPIYIEGDGELPYFVGTALMEDSDIIRKIPVEAKRVGVVTSGAIEDINLPGYTEGDTWENRGLKFIWYEKR